MTPQIAAAVDDLNEQLIEADAWMQALQEPENSPPWVFAVARMLERIDASAQALQELLNAQEVPA